MKQSNKVSLKLTEPQPQRDHIQGPHDAAIQMLEYGDYECPYCGAAHPIVKALQQELGNRLCFAFRNFPLTNAHPHAQLAAEAAEAAGAQGKFWEMHDLIYGNQQALEPEDLAERAATLGLDVARFDADRRSERVSLRVRAGFRAGVRAGVVTTPTIFVNDCAISGRATIEAVARIEPGTGPARTH